MTFHTYSSADTSVCYWQDLPIAVIAVCGPFPICFKAWAELGPRGGCANPTSQYPRLTCTRFVKPHVRLLVSTLTKNPEMTGESTKAPSFSPTLPRVRTYSIYSFDEVCSTMLLCSQGPVSHALNSLKLSLLEQLSALRFVICLSPKPLRQPLNTELTSLYTSWSCCRRTPTINDLVKTHSISVK